MTISNERGSALIITLMLLVILTAIGIYAISISTTEMNIALQSRVGTSTLNAADSGANVGDRQHPVRFHDEPARYPVRRVELQLDLPAHGNLDAAARVRRQFPLRGFRGDEPGGRPPQFTGTRGVQVVAIYGPVPMGTMY